ncbi:hypothetical protein WMY93_007440 [Mugilogobius chulae]|uniref:POF1B helix-loop-helix domain-containing protein n=1 Tax=Mugilogobius chulae TaxID=88201 RepID=A0AAW0PNP0_9GOBI
MEYFLTANQLCGGRGGGGGGGGDRKCDGVQDSAARTEDHLDPRELSGPPQPQPQSSKMDNRYFGELLAEVYRKNCDIHSCISEHVSKIKGSKMDSFEYKVDRDDVEALIPKGATELTKQQMRYLLQTRLTADKSMRLLLSTFSSLREELLHMSEDLRLLLSFGRMLTSVDTHTEQIQTFSMGPLGPPLQSPTAIVSMEEIKDGSGATGLWCVPMVSTVDLVEAEPVTEMCGAVGGHQYEGGR